MTDRELNKILNNNVYNGYGKERIEELYDILSQSKYLTHKEILDYIATGAVMEWANNEEGFEDFKASFPNEDIEYLQDLWDGMDVIGKYKVDLPC